MNKRVFRALSMAVLLVVVAVLTTGCPDDGQKPDPTNPANPSNAILTGRAEEVTAHSTNQPPTNVDEAGVVDYGNGVYFFPYTKAAFGNNLSKFLSNHKNLEVSAMDHDIVRMRNDDPTTERFGANHEWGGNMGHFVTFREKK